MARRRPFAELIACALLAVISPRPSAGARVFADDRGHAPRSAKSGASAHSHATGARAGRQSPTGDADVRACRWRR